MASTVITWLGALLVGKQRRAGVRRLLLAGTLLGNLSILFFFKYFVLRWPVIHTRYAELTRYDFAQYAPSEYGRGAGWGWEQGPGAWWGVNCQESAPLSDENLLWLDRILTPGAENDIDIVFWISMPPAWLGIPHE